MVRKGFVGWSLLLLVLAPLWVLPTPAEAGNGEKKGAPVNGSPAALVINPREVDLGMIGPGESAQGVFYLKNTSPGRFAWFIEGVEGWTQTEGEERVLAGSVGDDPQPLKLSLALLDENLPGRLKTASLRLQLEWGDATAVYRRQAPLGTLREAIRLTVPGGTRIAFFQVRLAEFTAGARLDVTPRQIDYGSVRPGDSAARRVQLTNRGREPLKWRVGLGGSRGMPAAMPPPVGRYLSYRNETLAGTGTYLPPTPLHDTLETGGPWGEYGGHPVAEGEQKVLRQRFTGTGISLFVLKTPEGGPFSLFIDDQFVDLVDGYSERRERVEVPVATAQPEGSHVLTVVNGEGRLILEGARLFGKPILRGPPGWISLFPDSGMTTRETDYVNISLNTRQMLPGLYGERILLLSSGGDADVEVFVEVGTEAQTKLLDVHRYVAGSDYLYTTDAQGEQKRLQAKGYRYLGVAFRLFSPGTPGTTEFFRWFNPAKGDHFYSHDPKGGGRSLAGYLSEGSIGHIATSRLTGTRTLFRWHNPAKGLHFYTTDEAGEGMAKKGYRFDGIAGFVR